jgi:translation initiation factor 2-alpha kinase 4
MEYCHKTLESVFLNDNPSDVDIFRYFRQILEGLSHMHSRNFIHRDLKPANIFLHENGDIKVLHDMAKISNLFLFY